MTEFDRESYPFALYRDGYVFCILDQKPTVHDQKSLIVLTNSEIVKVHAVRHYRLIRELQEINPTKTPVDESVISRKDAFKKMKPEQLNKPFPVKFSPHIETKVVSEVDSMIFRNQEGVMLDIPENLASDVAAQLGKLLNATFVVARFQVTYELLEKASPHRSQAKN